MNLTTSLVHFCKGEKWHNYFYNIIMILKITITSYLFVTEVKMDHDPIKKLLNVSDVNIGFSLLSKWNPNVKHLFKG